MDIYHKPLKSDKIHILLYLKKYINEISLCKKIINIKKISEKKDILNYHYDRWDKYCWRTFLYKK